MNAVGAVRAPTRIDADPLTRLERLRLIQFSAEDDPARYRRLGDIRDAVFGEELGWRLPRVTGPWLDPFDRGARLLMAETVDAEPIGILRALDASNAFPHRELFDDHLNACELQHRSELVGTLNALAVVRPYRRRLYCASPDGEIRTAAHLLLQSSLRQFAASGVAIVLATVLAPVSARAFLGAGFQLLDRPRGMPGQHGFTVANVGVVLPGTRRADHVTLERTRAYFADCHARVSAMGSVEHLFARSLSDSANSERG